jgi:hypothetical protein
LRAQETEDFEDLYDVARDPLIWEQHHAERFNRVEFDLFFKESIESKGSLVVIDKVFKKRAWEVHDIKNQMRMIKQLKSVGHSFFQNIGKKNLIRQSRMLMIKYAFTYFGYHIPCLQG